MPVSTWPMCLLVEEMGPEWKKLELNCHFQLFVFILKVKIVALRLRRDLICQKVYLKRMLFNKARLCTHQFPLN